MDKYYIFGSGEYGGMVPSVEDGAHIIAADGGVAVLEAAGLTPELIVGDFDSYHGPLPEGAEVIRRPVMKDETDMELAVREAVSRGAGQIVIYGGLGGRMDHSFANIQLLVMLARRGVRAYLAGPEWTVTALKDGRLTFGPGHRGTVSVFAYGGTAEVTETGLLYGLDRYVLRDDKPLGVSNELVGRQAEITVSDGVCVVMWQRGEDEWK